MTGIVPSFADGGTYSGYSPYSTFGVGTIPMPGTAYNRSMAGVGIASRDNHYLNCLNPAAVTARDSLAFMGDFSLSEANTIYRQGKTLSANNIFNINDVIFSFPIWKSSAMMVGIMPYSSTGYSFSSLIVDQNINGYTGDISASNVGQGSIYQLFVAYGATFLDKISIGAQYNRYFGNIQHAGTQTFGTSSYSGISQGNTLSLTANSAKFGMQFEQNLSPKLKFCLGATYSLDARLNGYIDSYKYATGLSNTTPNTTVDTLANSSSKVFLASETGLGIAMCYDNKLRMEFDYTVSDWTKSGMDSHSGFCIDNSDRSIGATFKNSTSQSFRFGMEYIPNRNDIRYYYKKWAYRAGAYYQTSYYKVDGYDISARGITLGVTLPVFRWYNGLTLGVDFGQRGTLSGNLVRESYVNFSIGVNMFDIWFQKQRYD